MTQTLRDGTLVCSVIQTVRMGGGPHGSHGAGRGAGSTEPYPSLCYSPNLPDEGRGREPSGSGGASVPAAEGERFSMES